MRDLKSNGWVFIGALLLVGVGLAGAALWRGASDARGIQTQLERLEHKVNSINEMKEEIRGLKATVAELNRQAKEKQP